MGVAVFVQMADHSLWPHLRECVGNVLEGAASISQRGAQLTRDVDVHIGMIAGNSTIEEDARLLLHRWTARGGEYRARLVVNDTLENKGADMGLFLQQIQQVRDPSPYSVLLKVHSKSSYRWRCQMLTSLCGSKEQVKHILIRFDNWRRMGLLGPWGLTWRYDDMVNQTKVEMSFDHLSSWAFVEGAGERFMRRAWAFMYDNDVPLPPRETWVVTAGTMFWTRAAPLLQNPRLFSAISRWLPAWELGYDTQCRNKTSCLDAYGLERVIPTVITHDYRLSAMEAPNRYVDNPKNNHGCNENDCMSSCAYALPLPTF